MMASSHFLIRLIKERMSTDENDLEIQDDLSVDKRVLLKRLSTVFDPRTAIGFLDSKRFEKRHYYTIEELLHVDYEQREKNIQRLRSMEHYQTTTQSLTRLDLEASYQAFVRSQVVQNPHARDELQQFVRRDADINAVRYYTNSSSPLQAHLLFHSSKLNEQKANLIKSASLNKTLKQLNDDLTLRQHFPEAFITESRSSYREKDSSENKQIDSQPRSMYVEHREKKYHVTFLKDSNIHPKAACHSRENYHPPRSIESLLDRESLLTPGHSTISTSRHENFPPLSLSALKEYRPTLTPKSFLTSTIAIQQPKADFIWEQSVVSPKHE